MSDDTNTNDTANTSPAGDAAAEPTNQITFDDFIKVELRVATIVEAELHPNADRLLKLQVDLGDGQRQICAGIKGHYEPADLVGSQIIVVANLAARKIRGEESNGMLMAATAIEGEGDEKTESVVLLRPDRQVPAGSRIS
jgi:tRNA-binding protein